MKKSTTTAKARFKPRPAKPPEVFGFADLQHLADAGDEAARDRLTLYWRLLNLREAIEPNLPKDHRMLTFLSGSIAGEETIPSMETLKRVHAAVFTRSAGNRCILIHTAIRTVRG